MEIPKPPAWKPQNILRIADGAAVVNEYRPSHTQHGVIHIQRRQQALEPQRLSLAVVVKEDDVIRLNGLDPQVAGLPESSPLAAVVYVLHPDQRRRLFRFLDNQDVGLSTTRS